MVALSGNSDTSTALEDQPSSRSFFSRFALPIRSRSTRNLVDFHIRPAEPHRKYNAGDPVKGAVVVAIVKPIRVTHLTVALRGFVRVYKNPNAANEPFVTPELVSDSVSQFRFLGNGYASLFQDEQVLCADGRLEAGKYEFNFELMFPEQGLPSSIEFERGTISYMITATLTRPTSIAPTSSCERKVEFVEHIDVGPLIPPRPRTIYLEPISKRAKKKRSPASVVSDKQNSASVDISGETSSDLESTRVIETSTDGSNVADESSQDAHTNPRSPVHSDLRSEVSGDSAVSGSTGLSSSRVDPSPGSLGTIQAGGGKRIMPGDKTITTTLELLKGGCLPGDTLPIRVNIQHTKPIRSLHGVIVTLYRQGRVDSAPPVSLFKNLSKEEMRRLEKEEYYPKSKTGLGGLSLTSAGSCSVFRKDLSQALSPLFIDPVTHAASITASVRVPENAFPSIRGVPGEMISFKYRLEILVDLGGKLSSAIQVGQNPRLAGGGGGGLSTTTDLPAGVASYDGSLINTDALKREKGVIFDSFEVVVGTTDSSRRGKAHRQGPMMHTHTHYYDGTNYTENGQWSSGWDEEAYGTGENFAQVFPPFSGEPAAQYPFWNGGAYPDPAPTSAAPQYIPPPSLPDESGLSEKERIRRAEQRLLPSRPETSPPPPPTCNDAGEGPSNLAAPTAPAISSPPPISESTGEAPSAPTLDDLAAGPSAALNAGPTDDKQELERRRLLTEASAPPEFPDDGDTGVGSSAVAGPSAPPILPEVEPSAPILTEEDEYGPQYSYNDVGGPSQAPSVPLEPLPAYQR